MAPKQRIEVVMRAFNVDGSAIGKCKCVLRIDGMHQHSQDLFPAGGEQN